MILRGDYHTHTTASDGHSDIKANVYAAKARNLVEVAITDHSFKSLCCHLTRKKFDAQHKEICALQDEVDVKVLHGVEANLINFKGDIDVPVNIIAQCDILHLGFHRFLQASTWSGALGFIVVNGFCPAFIRKKLVKKNTEAYLAAIDRYPVDVLVHLNHRALVDTSKICRAAEQKGIYVELNEKHLRTIDKSINEVLASGVKLIVGTDAHDMRKVGVMTEIQAFMAKHNIPEDRVYGIGRLPVFKDKSQWKLSSMEK